MIALRQGDRQAAEQAFSSAVELADQLLALNPRNYDTLETKALALCGLALLVPDEETRYERLAAGQESYRAAPGL